MKALFFLALVALLAGCATTPVSSESAALVPEARVIDASWVTPDAAKVPVTITRDMGFYGGGCAFRVAVGRRPVADLKQGERIAIYVPPGTHILQVTSAPGGICSMNSDVREALLEAKPGERIVMRVGMDQSGFQVGRTAY